MNGLEGLPTDILRMVFGLLDANTLQLVSQVSSHLHEQATAPEVWKERLPEVVGEGQWGRVSARFLELLRLRRFSKVVNFAFAGTEAVTAELWDQLVVEMEARGSRAKIGIKLTGNLKHLSPTSLARLLESSHCVDVGMFGGLTETSKELLLVAIGSPTSRVRHCRLKGTKFGSDAAVSLFLENIVCKTWMLHVDRTSFSEAQLSGINWALAGSRRTEEVPVGNCGLSNCQVAVEEEELRSRMERIANDFHSIFNQLMAS